MKIDFSEIDPAAIALEELDRTGSFAVDYARDPVRWVDEVAGDYLWSKQREIIEAVRDYARVAVKSCHSSGKTATAGRVAAWWIDSHPPGEAFVLTTAPTGPQVKALLWREINRLHQKANLQGYTNLTEWYIDNGGKHELVAFGRKPSEYSEGAFQGFHAKYVLIIMDEASGIPKPLWDAAESIASNEHSRILVIGNPDVTTGEFFNVCKDDSEYHVIQVGYKDTPAFTGEEVPDYLHDLLISPKWVESRKRAWGEDSALFQAKVLGEFPSGSTDPFVIIPQEYVMQCMHVDPEEMSTPDYFVHEAGIDVGGGGDRTVIVERVGNSVGRIETFQEKDPMQAVGRLKHIIELWGVTKVKIDVIGIGWGLAGTLRENLKESGVSVEGVNFAAKSTQPKKYVNIRAEAYWNGRTLSRDKKWSLANLKEEHVDELTCARYEIKDSNGKIQVESKDEIKKRLGRSPDVSDAILLAFYDKVKPALRSVEESVTAFASADLTGGRTPMTSFEVFPNSYNGIPMPRNSLYRQ